MTDRGQARPLIRYLVIFTTGLFGLAAQTLLFRDFFTVFEGHEIAIGVFFGSWLVWVAVGAVLARGPWAFLDRLARHFPLLALAYLPGYLVQSLLVASSRELAGVEVYELFPLARLVPMSFLVNAPVSLCTGFLFCLGCRWLADVAEQPVSRVYLAEAAGGVAGGIGVTMFLAAGWPGPSMVMLAASVLLAGIAVEASSRRAFGTVVLSIVVAGATWIGRVDEVWDHHRAVRDWSRLLPAESYEGSFTTAQARYLYGTQEGQFNVVAWNGVVDALPRQRYAAEIVAMHLAQQPRARRFLVVGPGSLAICRRLLDLPGTEHVSWLDTDPEYPARLVGVLPPAVAPDDERLAWPDIDVRTYLERHTDGFDVVMVNLPDITTLSLNRYFTREFFGLIRDRLTADGVVGVRTLGGENFMGDELVNIGASVYATLSEVFPELTLKPGDETWVFAANEGVLSSHPAELRDRFRAVRGSEALYPPEGLMSLFPPDRIAYQESLYHAAVQATERAALINTDAHPRALLHGLLLAGRQAGAGVGAAAGIYLFATHGLLLLPLVLLLLVAMRTLYLTHGPRRARESERRIPVFDLGVLVAATGCAGMGLSLVLMYWFQAGLGSIFLYVGMMSALFMAGLVGAGLLVQALLSRRDRLALPVLITGLILQAVVMLSLTNRLAGLTVIKFAGLFTLVGMLGGVYVPATASLLARYGVPVQRAAAAITLADHLGGALGGLAVGVLLLPLFGAGYALRLMVLLLLLLPLSWLAVLSGRQAYAGDRLDAVLRPLGYSLFTVAAITLGASLWMHHASRPSTWERLVHAARSMAANTSELVTHHGTGDLASYRYVIERGQEEEETAYCFTDLGLCEAAPGFAGPVHLAIRTSPAGDLLDFRLIESSETPSYVELLDDWNEQLQGNRLFQADALADIDGVTGATLTSEAVLQTLRQAGTTFAAGVLGIATGDSSQVARPAGPDPRAVALLTLTALALVLRVRPSAAARRILLLVAFVLTGWLLNVQYSLAQVFALLSGDLPPPGVTAAFLLAVGLPMLVILFGNLYCGYLCPFGALQELIGYLRPARLDLHPGPTARRVARFLKYGILFGCVLVFAASLNPREAAVDPLVRVFGAVRSPTFLSLIGVVLIAAVLFNRFWCRYLCPVGAFLALLNGVRVFRGLRPPVRPTSCGFGVRTTMELDCLQCDRCRAITPREQVRLKAQAGPAGRRRTVLFGVALIAALLLLARHAAEERGRVAAVEPLGGMAVAGASREADVRKLKHLAEQGLLSDREALHYHQLNPDTRTQTP